jgi:hypothetical protein
LTSMISCFIHIILLVLKFHGYSEPGAQSSRLLGLWEAPTLLTWHKKLM